MLNVLNTVFWFLLDRPGLVAGVLSIGLVIGPILILNARERRAAARKPEQSEPPPETEGVWPPPPNRPPV